MQVLAGDIGGTKTLVAICEVSPPDGRTGAVSVEVLVSKRYDSRKFPGIAALCRAFAAEVARPIPPSAGFGVAGPVANDRSQTTNLPWIVDAKDLAQALGIESVGLANDFQALAVGIPAVKAADLVSVNEGVRDPKGPWAVIGAGTGLGEAIATLGASGERGVVATEGGHASFAPRTELEIGVLRFLMQRYDHVSWERVLSGEGLVNLAEALSHLTGVKPTEALGEKIAHDRGNAPAAITAAAAAGDPLCRQVVELFCKLYGAEAGNLALRAVARSGIYLGGGIAPRILPALRWPEFLDSFRDKENLRPLLESIPVWVIRNELIGLLGAARYAAMGEG